MANRKEYEMLFALNAQMNGGFKGTFSKAQAEFAKLGKEIQALHRLQGDIASYQKQQRAIDATGAKLENLQKQHDMLQKEISETTGSTANLEREKLKLAQRIKDTESALERQKQKLEATGSKLKEAGVNTSELAQKDAELTAKIKELEAEQSKAADSASSFGANSAQAFAAVQQAIAAAGVAVALKEIADAFMECVSVAGDFEEAMSNVEALSGATAGDMDALSDQAKELGATTKFTAKESADAMGYMAMAGWDAAEMMSGMNGVLQLAAASGEDLAMVSDIVTDSLSAFGLTAADTAHFSDVLAAAATNSNTNVAIMGETFKMSASVAGALGYSIEDVAVAVGLMANSGVKGSIAGTALKNTFNGLLEGVTLTGEAFGEYEYSAVKADGSMKDFSSTIDELRRYFDQMTEAERVNNAMTIAGQRGYNGLLAILNATDEDYTSLTGSINNCAGAAQRMASIKLDNMNGQLVLMNSASEALANTIGEQFTPEMRGLYSIGTDVFNGLNEFVQANPALVKAGVAFVGVLGAATLGLTAFAAAGKIASALNLAALFTGPAGIAVAAIAGVAALTAAVVGFVTAANEGIPSVKELTDAAREMGEVMDEAATTYEDTATATLAAANVADTYISKLEEMGEYASLSAEEQTQYHNTLALLCQVVPDLADSIDLENNMIEGGTEALRANTEEWKKNAMAQAYQDQLTTMYQSYSAVLIEAEENSIGLTRAQYDLEAANKKHDETLARMKQLYAEAQQAATTYNKEVGGWSYATSFLTQEYYDLQSTLHQTNDEIRVAEGSVRNYTKAIDEDSEAVAEAKAEMDLAEEAVRNLTGVTEEQTEAEAEAARQNQELQSVIDGTTEQVAALTEAYNEAYGAALESVQGQYNLWDEAAEAVATSAGSINSALESQIDYWQDYNTNLQSLTERSADIAGLSDVIASFADGSADSVNAIAGMAGATDEDLAAMVANWQKLQEEQENTSDALAQIIADVPGQMQEIEDAMREGIEALEFSDEAAQAAHDTIQAFIDQADDMVSPVRGAYAQLGAVASNALAGRFGYNSQGINNYYASGTQNAEPGFAVVGEKGPEIVYFNGGEKVMTASETEAIQAGRSVESMEAVSFAPVLAAALRMSSSESAVPVEAAVSGPGADRPAPVAIQVAFQIEGNATPDVVDQLRTYGNEFAEQVLEVLEEHGIDTARRAYI